MGAARRNDRGGVPRRLRGLPLAVESGVEVPVAATLVARLLGLAFLDVEQAGAGLLIPACRSVHTHGMRFSLDVCFLARNGRVLRFEPAVPPGRLLSRRGADRVLEVPAGGESAALRT
jgi:uncharacterized protein